MNYENYASLGVNLSRQKKAPLDVSSAFLSIKDALYYVTEGKYPADGNGVSDYVKTLKKYPYEGQIISIKNNDEIKIYYISNIIYNSALTTDEDNLAYYFSTVGSNEVDMSNIYTKSEVDSKLQFKSNISDVYTKTQIDNKLAEITTTDAGTLEVNTTLKADEQYVTKTIALTDNTLVNIDTDFNTLIDFEAKGKCVTTNSWGGFSHHCAFWNNTFKDIDYEPRLKTKGHFEFYDKNDDLIYQSEERVIYGRVDENVYRGDILKADKFIKAYSDRFYFNVSQLDEDKSQLIATPNGAIIAVFKFIDDDFKDFPEPPKKYTESENSYLLTPLWTSKSNDAFPKDIPTTQDYTSTYSAFYWSDTDNCWYLKLTMYTAGNKTGNVSSIYKAIMKGKPWFKYELTNPIVEKMPFNQFYMNKGCKVKYVVSSDKFNNVACCIVPSSFSVTTPTNINGTLNNVKVLNDKLEYVYQQMGGTEEQKYTSVELNTANDFTASYKGDYNTILNYEVKAGNCKSSGERIYNVWGNEWKGKKYPAIKSSGHFEVCDFDDNIKYKTSTIDLYGNSSYGDILTNTGIKKYFSDDFVLSTKNLSEDEGGVYIFNTKYAYTHFVFKYTEDDFKIYGNLPCKNLSSQTADILVPIFTAISTDMLRSKLPTSGNVITGVDAWYGNYISMYYDDNISEWIVDLLFYSAAVAPTEANINNSKSSWYDIVMKGKYWFRYLFEAPQYKASNIDKLYADTNDIVKFISEPNTKTPASVNILIPQNLKATLDSFGAIAENINVLNYKVDNVTSSGGGDIGANADGVNDDRAVIQNLIDNAKKPNGEMKQVILPTGTYALSEPIVINQSFSSLSGDGGEVILKPLGIFPAIVVSGNITDINIKNLKIHLPYTMTEEDDNGWHSGIYVQSNDGTGKYRLYFDNIQIQGSYGYHNKDTEKSYGIYFSDGATYTTEEGENKTSAAICYYIYITNIGCYGVYCGIRSASGCQPMKVSFGFDRGNIINGLNSSAVIGWRYGAIVNSSTGFWEYFGQNIGADNDPDAKENQTVENLSRAVIKVKGVYNMLYGYSYDPQRADAMFEFAPRSRGNRYYNSYYAEIRGSNSAHYTQNLYKNDIETEDNLLIKNYTTDLQFVKDYGQENKPMFPIYGQLEALSGFLDKVGVDESGQGGLIMPKHYGQQDNTLAYVDKWGAVNYYIKDSTETLNVTENQFNIGKSPTNNISPIFSPADMTSSIIFDTTPTKENPIVIDISLPDSKKIIALNRFNLQFDGEYIAKKFEIKITNAGGYESAVFATDSNQQSTISFLGYNMNNNGGHVTFISVKKISIIIYEAYSNENYNTDKKVGIRSIFATDGYGGGKTWLSSNGGDVYGDLNLKGYLKLKSVSELPDADEGYRGKTVVMQGDTDDYLYVCVKRNGIFVWEKVNG